MDNCHSKSVDIPKRAKIVDSSGRVKSCRSFSEGCRFIRVIKSIDYCHSLSEVRRVIRAIESLSLYELAGSSNRLIIATHFPKLADPSGRLKVGAHFTSSQGHQIGGSVVLRQSQGRYGKWNKCHIYTQLLSVERLGCVVELLLLWTNIVASFLKFTRSSNIDGNCDQASPGDNTARTTRQVEQVSYPHSVGCVVMKGSE